MKKTLLNCSITIGFSILFLLILWSAYGAAFGEKTEEEKAVDYIMKNIWEFEDDFFDMGYEVKLAYTEEDLGYDSETEPDEDNEKSKLGFRGDGILILTKNNQEFHFDAGFDYYKLHISDEDFLSIGKTSRNIFTILTKTQISYPLVVGLSKSDENGDFMFIAHNAYDENFINYYTGNDVFSKSDRSDRWIKKYYCAEELRGIYEECIALQDKLVRLHKAHVRQGISSLFNKFPPKINP